jgi:hypothetical protein
MAFGPNGSETMAQQDPVSAVASWLAPATPGQGADPVVALLAERERLDHLCSRSQDAIHQLEATLPEVITCGKVPVKLPDGAWWFLSEKDLEEWIDRRVKLVEAFTVGGEPPDFTPNPSDTPQMQDSLKRIAAMYNAVASSENAWPERAREEFRARKARIAEIREETGLEALYRKAHDLGYQIDDVDDQIWRSQATSFAGLLGQLALFRSDYGELDDEEGGKNKLDLIIAGVKAALSPGAGEPDEGGAA